MNKRIIFLCLLTLSVFLIVLIQLNSQATQKYAGEETCKSCHEDAYMSYLKSAHSKKVILNSPANKYGCESCHGPGVQHVEKGGGKGVGELIAFSKKEQAKKKTSSCLNCHANSRHLTFWDSSIHNKNDISCTDCHSVHHRKEMSFMEYETCTKCHKEIKAQINKRSRHPILEGKVKCSNCHNPHGSLGPSMIKADSFNELCYKCHAEKRGPYLWEHPPVEENCGSCHTPHGSRHAKLMNQKIPNLCQACHDWQRHPGTRYSQETGFTGISPSNRFFARSCLNCHNSIHGSNAPVNPASGYNSGKAFVR